MKLAILGTRGIPNHYGGFEQFAQYISKNLVKRGHDVTVYNSHNHPYQLTLWEGVRIIHCYDPEKIIGTAGQFIYDLNCIIDIRRRNFDIVLQLGYTSSSVWNWLFPKKTIIITNMDGLEWKRSKYSFYVQSFLRFAEKIAIKHSNYIISDSIGIKKYVESKFSKSSHYIPYGANFEIEFQDSLLDDFQLSKNDFFLLIARIEPENNIEDIIQGFLNANTNKKLVIVGSTNTKFGRYLEEKYVYDDIKYLQYINNDLLLNTLRKNALIYFHGHSVGGTNPSLLEAMAANAFICANNNEFNKSILEKDALYFNSSLDVTTIINEGFSEDLRVTFAKNNYRKIQEIYNWDVVSNQYETFLLTTIQGIEN